MLQMFVNKILCANMHTLTLGSWGGRKGAAFYDAAKKDYLMSISASKLRALFCVLRKQINKNLALPFKEGTRSSSIAQQTTG